jgi:hypothetical protein
MRIKLKKTAELEITYGANDSSKIFKKGTIFNIDPNDDYDDDAYISVGTRANEFSVIIPKNLCVAV